MSPAAGPGSWFVVVSTFKLSGLDFKNLDLKRRCPLEYEPCDIWLMYKSYDTRLHHGRAGPNSSACYWGVCVCVCFVSCTYMYVRIPSDGCLFTNKALMEYTPTHLFSIV